MSGGGIMEFHRAGGGARRRLVRRSWVIGLVGVVAVVCSSCAGGPQHLGAKAAGHKAALHVRTDPMTIVSDPVASTTTTTAPSPVPAVKTTLPPAPAPAPVPVTTTTTTVPLPPACVWSNFAAKVTTDQSTYTQGQPVQIALELANAGPACTVNQTGYACPLVNIDNASGSLVWSNGAPVSSGCPTTFTGPTVLAANWSQTFSFSWAQVTCTPGQTGGCPGPQVPAGQYQVTGQSGGGSSQIPAGAPVAITITS